MTKATDLIDFALYSMRERNIVSCREATDWLLDIRGALTMSDEDLLAAIAALEETP